MSYTIAVLASGAWITPSGAPNPATPADLVYTIPGINGPGLLPNNPAQNIAGDIALAWTPATAPVQATITIPQAVLFNADRTQLQKAWEKFLAALDAQGTNQYMQPAGVRTTASLLAQNMPMLLTEVSYYRLRFGPGALYIDLQPGMRLQIGYGNFYNEAHAGAGQQARNFSAMGASYADIQSAGSSNGLLFNTYMALQQVTVLPSANPVSSTTRVASSLLDLAGQPVKPYHRVFYPQNGFTGSDTATLSADYGVSIVSTYCYSSLGATPGSGPVQEACNPLYPALYPTVFFGRCVMIVQVFVRINGKSVYVSAGTTVKNTLETTQAGNSQPRAFRLFRYLNGQKTSVIFPTGNTTVGLTLQVLPGDEIAWLPSGNFQLIDRLQAIYRITNPSPDATTLGNLGIKSFGEVPLYGLPAADDMAQALLASHDKPAPYTAAQIGPALFSIYNKTPFTDPYTGGMLAYSLYFAGFGAIDVATGVVAGYTPAITMQTGGLLVNFLLASGIGYAIGDVSDGVYQALDGNTAANAPYLVMALITGSVQCGQAYAPEIVAQGTYHAVGYTVANAFQLCAALMQGSSMAEPAKQEYPATVTAPALVYAFATAAITLMLNDLAIALVKALQGQPLAYPVDQVALGLFQAYPLSDATAIATALLNGGGNYSMNDVAKGTYAIRNYGPSPGHTLSTEELASALYTAYGSGMANTPLNSAIALVYAIPNETPNPVAVAVAKVFGYLSPTPYSQDHINTIAQAVVGAFRYTVDRTYLKSDAQLVTGALLAAFTGITIQQMLPGLRSGIPAFLPVDAGSLLTTTYQLNTSSATDIALLGNLAGTSYQLTVAPYGVASVSLLLFGPGYAYLPCSGWIGGWYAGWSGTDFTIFNNVFNTPIWAQALKGVNGRQTLNIMATTLQQSYDTGHTMANEMVQILAACYYYIDAAVSVVPVGTAMKAAGYTLIQTSGAMGSGQYQSQWNINYYKMLVAVFTGNH